jgi:hypothetical protein
MKAKEGMSLYKDRHARADRVFEEIHFPSSVEDHDGWESFSGGVTTDRHFNTFSKVVYLRNEEDPEGPTIKATFSLVFRPGSCVPSEAWLGDKELVLP